jgi:hypothetical protein
LWTPGILGPAFDPLKKAIGSALSRPLQQSTNYAHSWLSADQFGPYDECLLIPETGLSYLEIALGEKRGLSVNAYLSEAVVVLNNDTTLENRLINLKSIGSI